MLALLLAVLPGLAAAAPPGGELTATPIDLKVGLDGDSGAGPGDPGARHPRLARGADGVLRLTWSRREGDVARVLFAPLFAGAGTELARGSKLFVNWADAPVVTADGAGRVRGAWLEALDAGPYAYGVRAGAPGGAASWLHADQSAVEHGFVSLAPRADGVDAVWLDGRAAAGAHGRAETALYFRALDADGGLGAELELDPRVCDCCQTALARLADGTLVCAYRDRSAGEERDVSFVRVAEGASSAPAPVHADRWRIDGCPVNGPALAARADRVACAWYTEAPTPCVLLALSTPGASGFEAPVRVDQGETEGRVDVAWLEDGSVLVSHLVAQGGEASWRVRRVVDGVPGGEIEVATVAAGRESGFLRLAAEGDGAVAVWNSSEGGLEAARIQMAIPVVPEGR